MKRRLTYALAGLALLLSVAAGALAAEIDRAASLAGTINGTMEVTEDAAPSSPAAISDRDFDGYADTAILVNGDIDVVPPPALATTYDLENILVSSY